MRLKSFSPLKKIEKSFKNQKFFFFLNKILINLMKIENSLKLEKKKKKSLKAIKSASEIKILFLSKRFFFRHHLI